MPFGYPGITLVSLEAYKNRGLEVRRPSLEKSRVLLQIQLEEMIMNIASLIRISHCPAAMASLLIAVCSPSMLARAADPSPVPLPHPTIPLVNIANPTPLAKAEGIQNPFQSSLDCTLSSATITCQLSNPPPANRRVILEYVSAACTLAGPIVLLSGTINTAAESTEVVKHALLFTDRPLNDGSGRHVTGAAQVVKIYADKGSPITFTGELNTTTAENPPSGVKVSGQCVDVP